MDQNKKLIYFITGIFCVALLMTLGVMAHDRQIDKCIVDHLFHFHLDEGAIHQEIEKQQREKEDKKHRIEKWLDDIYMRDTPSWDSDRGTVSPPDNNGNRDR